ncbi:MAG: hypothetical protein JWM86_1202 [Thermoleophilia bacterium]|nr:hypothetical protein [Thermoleophilia bacterium]
MCAIAPASQQLPAAPLATASPAPASTSAGGPAPAEAPTLAAAIQALTGALTTLQSILAGMIGGAAPAAAATAGAALPVAGGGAMGAPTAAPAGAAAPDAGDHDHDAAHGAHAGMANHHGMAVHERTAPVNEAIARRNLAAVVQSFSKHGRAGLDFKNNRTHGYLSKAEQDRFRAQNPGLPVPQSLVFEPNSNVPIGVVYRSTIGKFDLGMGSSHQHKGANNEMQHLWFTPNHLDFAFSDVENGLTGSTAAAMRKLGYRTR